MRWRVTGADATTGHERVTSFEASCEADAQALGNYNGILVDEVVRIDAKPVANLVPYEATVGIDDWRDFDVGVAARTVQILGALCLIFGVIGFIGGAVALGFGIAEFSKSARATELAWGGAIATACGVILLTIGAILRLLSGMAMLLRSIDRRMYARGQKR